MKSIFEFSHFELEEFVNRLDDDGKQRVLNNIAALILSQRLEVFNDEGGDEKWKPLSNLTMALREAKVTNNFRVKQSNSRIKLQKVKILQDTGALRQSFSSARGFGNMYRATIISQDSAAIESHLPYAAIQNFGGTITPKSKKALRFLDVNGNVVFAKKVTIPARPFDQFREKDITDIEMLLEEFIGGKLNR